MLHRRNPQLNARGEELVLSNENGRLRFAAVKRPD